MIVCLTLAAAIFAMVAAGLYLHWATRPMSRSVYLKPKSWKGRW